MNTHQGTEDSGNCMSVTSRGTLNFVWQIGYLLGPLDVSGIKLQNW